jgi:hypothetical protein
MKSFIKPFEAVIIIVAAMVCAFIIFLPKQAAKTAVITWTDANKNTHTAYVPLDKDSKYTMNDLFGTDNALFDTPIPDMIFEVSEHDIRVCKSDCPGQNCVHANGVRVNSVIVCVPNRVVIHEKRVGDLSGVKLDASV